MAVPNKTPLKLSQIPTRNKLIVIDNYSPSFNYIVEDDKVYYSKKGNNDYWVDISENDKARENLYRFLNDKYDFRGYDDREKEIYGLIMLKELDSLLLVQDVNLILMKLTIGKLQKLF